MHFTRKKTNEIFREVLIFTLAAVFLYAAFAKIQDYDTFHLDLSKSPIFHDISSIIAVGVLCLELGVCVLLFNEKTRAIGILIYIGTMAMFITYIIYIMNFSSYVPCSCGGILGSLGWPEHLLFNAALIVLASISYLQHHKIKNKGVTENP